MATPETDLFRIVTATTLLYDPNPNNGRTQVKDLINLHYKNNPEDREVIKRNWGKIANDVSRAVSEQMEDEYDD